MGKLIWFNMVTPEGYFEDEHGSLDWHNVDDEFTVFAIEQLEQSGALLFGRKTFEIMEAFWLSNSAFENNPVVENLMSNTMKFVVSKTLKKSAWENVALINDNLMETVIELKQSQKNLLMFGSATLANSFMELGLVDEFRFLVNPLLLGGGKPLFKKIDPVKLKLVSSKVFQSGNVLLCYAPDEQPKYASL